MLVAERGLYGLQASEWVQYKGMTRSPLNTIVDCLNPLLY